MVAEEALCIEVVQLHEGRKAGQVKEGEEGGIAARSDAARRRVADLRARITHTPRQPRWQAVATL